MTEHGESENHLGPAREASATAPSVFISYASHDATIAQKLCAELEAAGTPCWIAPRDVVPGTLYADGIVRAIDDSSIFVLILSEQAVASAHVGRELERAVSKRHPIIALKTDAAPLTRAFEYFLNQSQWIDVSELGIEAAAAKLAKAVGCHLNASAEANSTHLHNKSGASHILVPRTKWMVIGVVVIASLAVAYFAVNHFWMPAHGSSAAVSEAGLGRANGAADKVDTAAPAPPAASVAVLAFSDLSADGSQSYFSDGMAEEILNVLAHVKGFKVASRTSSFRFRKSDLGIPAIAAKLGVRHILEGSVRKAGDTVRITVQLIDASTDEHEWSQTFDRPLSTANLFAIQDEIANTIVEHLAAMIGSPADVAKPPARKADTADADAYALYLKGRSLFIARSRENLMAAAVALKAAVARDPKFARAWEMLAAVLMVSESWGIGDESFQKEAAEDAEMAVRLDPNLSLAYAISGLAQVITVPRGSAANWEKASDNFSRAIEHDGTNATAFAWRAMEYAALGYFDQARQDYGRCLDIDPAYELCRRHLALADLYLGLTDDAFRLYELNFANGYFGSDTANFAPAAAARGERVSALNMITQEFRQEPQLVQPLYRALTDPSFSEHDRQSAIELVDATKGIGYFVPIALWILKAYDKINAKFDPPIWWARGDTAWLTSHGRKQIMQRWHLPDYWRKHGFPPQCAPIGETDFECH